MLAKLKGDKTYKQIWIKWWPKTAFFPKRPRKGDKIDSESGA